MLSLNEVGGAVMAIVVSRMMRREVLGKNLTASMISLREESEVYQRERSSVESGSLIGLKMKMQVQVHTYL